MKQGYKDKMDESYGMKKSMKGSSKKADNVHAYGVEGINTNSEDYDMNRVKRIPPNSKGYPSQAWE